MGKGRGTMCFSFMLAFTLDVAHVFGNIIICFFTLTYCSIKMSLYLLHFSDLQSNAFSMLQA